MRVRVAAHSPHPAPTSLASSSAVLLGFTLAWHIAREPMYVPCAAETGRYQQSVPHLLPAPMRPHGTPGASMPPPSAASAGRLAAEAEALSAALRAVDTCLAAHRRMQEALEHGVLEQQEQLDKVGSERAGSGRAGRGMGVDSSRSSRLSWTTWIRSRWG